jgi:hypothetical protein
MSEAAAATDAFEQELDEAAGAAGSAGSAAAAAGDAAAAAADRAAESTQAAATGWQAVTAALSDYASRARDISGDIGNTLVGAFRSAETAIGEFVKTGKLDFRSLVTSLIADLAQLAARRFILGPLANALSGALGGLGGGLFANVFHAGGLVGGAAPTMLVPQAVFADAPRLHSGGWAGLKPDEVPAILQRGERVLSRREAAAYGAERAVSPVNITIITQNAESFRQSRTQVAADIARAVSLGRRGM